MSRLSLFPVVIVVATSAACDLFAIRCNDDDDCPAEVPFCNADVCQATAGGSRAEGEGERECVADADCGKDLCYDLQDGDAGFDAALVGTCVPGDGTDRTCAEAADFNGSVDRPDGGAALFSVTATRVSPVDCAPAQSDVNLSVRYLDREADAQANAMQFIRQDDVNKDFTSSSPVGDGTSGEASFVLRCVDDTDVHVAVVLGSELPASNPVCVPLSGGGGA